jgi:DNA-binding Lrp family transcriptional regulator
MSMPLAFDDIDRRIVVATQAGLPLCEEPYDAVAAEVGIPADDVIRRLKRLLSSGVIRRIGAVPNHYALGYRANGMSVWDIADAQVTRIGHAVGALDFVSHCYRRPRRRPDWPYNLFAMVHGHTRADVDAKVEEIARLVGPVSRGHTVLYSTRILKKTGLRLTG